MTVFKKCDKASIQRPITSSNFVINQCKVHIHSLGNLDNDWFLGKVRESLRKLGNFVVNLSESEK